MLTLFWDVTKGILGLCKQVDVARLWVVFVTLTRVVATLATADSADTRLALADSANTRRWRVYVTKLLTSFIIFLFLYYDLTILTVVVALEDVIVGVLRHYLVPLTRFRRHDLDDFIWALSSTAIVRV